MEYKWNVASVIVVALISGMAGAYTAYTTTENNVTLEKIKLEAESLKAKREHFSNRCIAMNNLYKEMTFGMQNLYMDSSPDDTKAALKKVVSLRSQRQVAHSYFGVAAQKAHDEY